jgi:peptidoglycan hydrolase-like protein with peptidoglycan-binding domain
MRFVFGLLLLAVCVLVQATPLHEAARTGDIERVRSELAAGADINLPDEYGFTPLLLAQINEHSATSQLLQDNGAEDGLTALVEQLQRNLRAAGHDPGSIDGALGPATRAAIRAYQREIGAPVNGRVREAWVRILHQQLQPPTTATREPPASSETARILRLQASLTVLGHDTGGVDGIVGPATRNAISRFQQAQNMRVDGNASVALSNQVEKALTRDVQQQLNRLGFDPGPVDGLFGENTQMAITAFERQQGMPVSGQVSPALAARLEALQTLTDAPPEPPAIVVTDEQPIRTAQTHLHTLGLEPGTIDGQLGPNTRQALRRFQAQRGLSETGELTDQLLALLAEAATQTTQTPPPRREHIQEIQSRLNSLGYNAGSADGVHGPRTASAIRQFERRIGRPTLGQPSDAILEALRTTPLAEAQALPAQGEPTSGGNTAVNGQLVLQYAGAELLGCAINGVQLDRSWCEPFQDQSDTSDCQALLRPDARVIMVRCN